MILAADRIVFGDSALPPQHKAVWIRDGIIRDIAPLDALQAQHPHEEVREYPGCTLLPGLIDMHIHMGVDGSHDTEKRTDYLWALSAAALMKRTLAAGVTTVRDVSSRNGLAASLKRAGELGYITVPRIITCNQGICMTGGHGADITGIALECDGEWEIRKAIRTQFRQGADWIKILTSEGYRGEEFKQEELDAAVDECHRMGRRVAVHAGYPPSTSMCVKAGFDTIEHGTYLTVEEAQVMKERGMTWVPTIIAFAYIADHMETSGRYSAVTYIPQAVEIYRSNFKKLFDTGVNTVCGTDQMLEGAPVSPVAQECEYMVKYGITPLEAIACATKNGALALGLEEEIGQVKEGLLADLIVVKGDPTGDIAALQQVEATYLRGQPV